MGRAGGGRRLWADDLLQMGALGALTAIPARAKSADHVERVVNIQMARQLANVSECKRAEQFGRRATAAGGR